VNESVLSSVNEISLYACKIQATTNGRWCSPRRQTGKTFQVVAQRCIETNGKIDERKTIARLRKDKAQEITEKESSQQKTPLTQSFAFNQPSRPFALTARNRLPLRRQ
jgi:hypothetical protein